MKKAIIRKVANKKIKKDKERIELTRSVLVQYYYGGGDMAIDMDLAKRLKTYRNFKHLTQKDVAAHLNVPHSAISDIENGKRDVTVGELKILSHLYGRSVEEIMSGKKYDYYNIANIARLLTELPDDDLKEVMFIIEYKRKRLEEKSKANQ